MKRFLILVGLATALSGSQAVAADLFPWWFHTRPKPVLMDDLPPAPPAQIENRAPVRPVSHTNTNIPDNRRERPAQSSKPAKSRLTELLTRGWRTGSH